jgi:glycosyltransferase involved in cell wall biosynthesis
VRFLGAVVDPKPVYVACDLVVIPSLWEEPFGLIPLEAVACGALPLVSDRGFLPQIVDEVDRGLIHPAGNPEELSRKIKDWLNQSNKITVEKLQQFHKKHFDNSKGTQIYAMIVADLLKKAYP